MPRRKSEALLRTEALTNVTMPDVLIPSRKAFEAVGFLFSKRVGNSEVDAEIPMGWTRISVGAHRVVLYDERGRLRAEIYRQSARLLPRYKVVQETDRPGIVTWEVRDSDTILYRASCRSFDYESQDEIFGDAKKWLMQHYENAEDPTAYW